MQHQRPPSICERLQVPPQPPLPATKLGIALASLHQQPIQGMRIALTETTNGWYLWCGELSDAADFFAPLHTEHVQDFLPAVLDYLDLPPGYRFIIDNNNYEDVWFDGALLEPQK